MENIGKPIYNFDSQIFVTFLFDLQRPKKYGQFSKQLIIKIVCFKGVFHVYFDRNTSFVFA